MRLVRWTVRARTDLSAIRAFIAQDSPHYARVTLARIIAATDRLPNFPEWGRQVPELDSPEIREVIRRPYRIVYRLVGANEIHILTVHHSARELTSSLD